MSGVKRLCSGVLAVSISLVAIAPPILQPIQAQTQKSDQQQELKKLLQQGTQQRQQGKPTEAIATFQQALTTSKATSRQKS